MKNFIYLFIYTFFHELTYRSDPSTDFHACIWLKRRSRTRAKVCLLGASLILLPILGVKFPNTPNFGASITVFKKDGQNIEFFILSKLQHRFQPNFAQRQRSPSSHRGWSQYAPNKSKMANGRHFEKKPLNRHISATV